MDYIEQIELDVIPGQFCVRDLTPFESRLEGSGVNGFEQIRSRGEFDVIPG